MAGFGTTTFGTDPFGTGTASSTAVGTGTKSRLKARAFDPLTKDYVWDLTEQDFVRWPRTRQRVWLALTTKRGDLLGLPGWGIVLPEKVTPTFNDEVRLAVEDALKPVPEAQLRQVQIQVTGSRLQLSVSYVDLDTGLPGDLGVLYGA